VEGNKMMEMRSMEEERRVVNMACKWEYKARIQEWSLQEHKMGYILPDTTLEGSNFDRTTYKAYTRADTIVESWTDKACKREDTIVESCRWGYREIQMSSRSGIDLGSMEFGKKCKGECRESQMSSKAGIDLGKREFGKKCKVGCSR
jgi:hypothetical protein